MARKPTKLPWLIYAADATETARYLIAQAGGVGAAHAAITRAAKAQKKPQGKTPHPDTIALLLDAEAVQRDEGCSDRQAMLTVARQFTTDEDAAQTVLRRLQYKLRGKTLKKVLCKHPFEATRETDGFAFRLRE